MTKQKCGWKLNGEVYSERRQLIIVTRVYKILHYHPVEQKFIHEN